MSDRRDFELETVERLTAIECRLSQSQDELFAILDEHTQQDAERFDELQASMARIESLPARLGRWVGGACVTVFTVAEAIRRFL